MSVTFWCPEAPTRKVIPYPDQDPDFVIDESDQPEIKLANVHARAALEMLGLSDEECGTLAPEVFDEVLARLNQFLTCSLERSSLLEPDTVNGLVACGFPQEAALVLDMEPACVGATATGSPDGSSPRSHGKLLLEMLSKAAPEYLPAAHHTVGSLLAESHRGMRMVSFGRDDSYLRGCAERFVGLLTQAKEHNYRVCGG